MRRITMAIAAVGVIAGSLAGAHTAGAAATDNNPPVQPGTPVPVTTALNCVGFTGFEGCGPGWFWRDGWRGWSCYPC
ncbi:MAG: hypothetical protein ACKOQ4_08385 [Mycobacterium sp.]